MFITPTAGPHQPVPHVQDSQPTAGDNDGVRRVEGAGEGGWHAQAQDGQGLGHALAQAGGGARVGLVQLGRQPGQQALGFEG
jgi:hypothetical protein